MYFLLGIRYGSAGQTVTGPLQYRARKKVGAASMKGMPMESLEPTGSACKPVTVTCEVTCEAVDMEPGEQPFSVELRLLGVLVFVCDPRAMH